MIGRNADQRTFFQKHYKPLYREKIDKDGTRAIVAYYGNGRFSKPFWIFLHVILGESAQHFVHHCWTARLSRTAWLIIHVDDKLTLLALLLINLIVMPWAYFVYFPSFLQASIDEIGKNGKTVEIYKQSIGPMSSNNVTLSADIRLKPWSVFPLPGGFGDVIAEVVSTSAGGNEKRLASVHVPGASFLLNQVIVLDKGAVISWDDEQVKNVHDTIAAFSSPEGLKDFGIKVKLTAPVLSMGMTLYSALPLHREFFFGDVASSDLLKSNLAAPLPPVVADNTDPPALEFVNIPEKKSEMLENSKYTPDQISEIPASFGALGGTKFVFESFTPTVDDNGLGAAAGIAFDNWTPFSLSKIEKVELFLGLEGVRTAKIVLSNLTLDSGLNRLNPSTAIEFMDELIDHEKVQDAIETASQSLANSLTFKFSVMGPVRISGADFAEKVTTELDVGGQFSQILAVLPENILDLLRNPGKLLNNSAPIPPEIASILGNSTLNLQVLNEVISSSADLNLPAIDFLKLPPKIEFPFNASISIYGSSEKAIEFSTIPISIDSDQTQIMIKAGLNIVPTNTDSAASGLAKALNPILAASPTNSSIGIKDFSIFSKEGVPFKWTTELFGKRILNIGLPPIDKAAIVDALLKTPAVTNAIMDSSKKLLDIVVGPINLYQMTDKPGFGASGNVQIKVGQGFPTIKVDMGYLNADTTVEDVKLASLRLPQGIKFTPDAPKVDLNAALIMNRDQALAGSLQRVADSLLVENNFAIYLGTTGLAFGASASNHIVTFSKIILNIETKTVSKVLNQLSLPGIDLPPGLLKIKSADLKMASSNSVLSAADVTIKNPTKFGVSLGSTVLQTTMNGKMLAGIAFAPIKVSPGLNSVRLGLTLTPSSGANGLNDDMAKMVNSFINSDSRFAMSIGIAGLSLSPPGVSSGSAVIDMFKNLKVSVHSGKLIELLSSLPTSTGSPVDLSGILPPKNFDILKQFDPSVKFLKLVQQPSSHIAAGADATYKNPLAVSASVPYIALTATLDGSEAVDIQLSSISLARQGGSMKPRMVLGFKKNLSVKMAKLIDGLLDGQLPLSLGVGNIFFGSSSSDNNNLFSRVSLDVTSTASSLFKSLGPQVSKSLRETGAAVRIVKRDLSSHKTASDSSVTIKGPYGISATLSRLDAEVRDTKEISTIIEASLKLPFAVDINMPYFAADLNLDSTRFVDLAAGLIISGTNPTTRISTTLKINDVSEIADKVGSLVEALTGGKSLPGTVGLGGIMLGSSKEDSNDALSKLSLNIQLAKFTASSSSSSSPISLAVNTEAIINSIDLNLQKIIFNTLPGRKVSFDTALDLKLPFAVSVKGLGHLSSILGVDDQPVASISSSGFGIAAIPNAKQSLKLQGATSFFSSSKLQDKMASFVSNVESNLGNTNEKLFASSLSFGHNEGSSFKFLSKTKIVVQSKMLITQELVNQLKASINNFDLAKAVPSNLFLKNIKLRTRSDSTIDASLAGGLSKSNIQANFALGHAGMTLLLDNQRVLDFGLVKPFTLANQGVDVLASLSNYLSISKDSYVTQTIATLAQNVQNNVNVANTVGTTGLVFGYSASDYIDTFSKVRISLKVQSILDFAKPLIKKATLPNLPAAFKISTASKIELDVVEEGTLSTLVDVQYSGLGADLDIDIPLAFASVKFNDKDFVSNKITGLKIQNNRISAMANVIFPENREATQKVFTIIGNILWGYNIKLKDSITLYNAGLGYSKDSKVSLLEKVNIKVLIDPYIESAATKGFGVSMLNLDTSIEHEGIQILARITDFLGFPLVIKNTIKSDAKWALNGTTNPSEFITMMQATGYPFTIPNAKLLLAPTSNVKDMVLPMREALLNLLTWKSYGENARLGFLTLVGSGGAKFTRFDQAWFKGPNWLTGPSTLYVESILEKAYYPMPEDTFPIYFGTTVSVINNSPFHLNAGVLEMYSEAYDRTNPHGYHTVDPDSLILTLLCDSDLIVRNFNEGGNKTIEGGKHPVQARFHGSLVAFGYLDWYSLLETAFAVNPISGTPGYRTIIRTKRNGEYVKWFDDFNYAMEDSYFTSTLLPYFPLITKHLVYSGNVPSSAQ